MASSILRFLMIRWPNLMHPLRTLPETAAPHCCAVTRSCPFRLRRRDFPALYFAAAGSGPVDAAPPMTSCTAGCWLKLHVGRLVLITVLSCFLAGTNASPQPHGPQRSMCRPCAAHTVGVCQHPGTHVCYSVFTGTTTCPPGTLACGDSAASSPASFDTTHTAALVLDLRLVIQQGEGRDGVAPSSSDLQRAVKQVLGAPADGLSVVSVHRAHAGERSAYGYNIGAMLSLPTWVRDSKAVAQFAAAAHEKLQGARLHIDGVGSVSVELHSPISAMYPPTQRAWRVQGSDGTVATALRGSGDAHGGGRRRLSETQLGDEPWYDEAASFVRQRQELVGSIAGGVGLLIVVGALVAIRRDRRQQKTFRRMSTIINTPVASDIVKRKARAACSPESEAAGGSGGGGSGKGLSSRHSSHASIGSARGRSYPGVTISDAAGRMAVRVASSSRLLSAGVGDEPQPACSRVRGSASSTWSGTASSRGSTSHHGRGGPGRSVPSSPNAPYPSSSGLAASTASVPGSVQ